MHSHRRYLHVVAFVGLICMVWLLVKSLAPEADVPPENHWQTQPPSVEATKAPADGQDSKLTSSGLLKKQEFNSARDSDQAQPTTLEVVTTLTAGNFEALVNRCFQGEACELAEDPWSLYQHFKTMDNSRALDNLIAFLRSKVKEPKLQDVYKDALKRMIDDFYPPEEKQFQEAAYYNYLGDLQKSLDLYLDLERKARSDPSLRPAPKLNIANTYYDLHKFREALPYYQAALDEYISGQQDVAIPSRNEMVRFIESRIEDTRGRSP